MWRRQRTRCRRTLAASLLAICACGRTTGGPSTSQRTIDALIAERFTPGRLAHQTAWQECRVRDTTALVPRARCGELVAATSKSLERIEQRLLDLSRAGQDSSPSYRRAAALYELRTADTSTRGISRAIRSLEGARRLAPNDPAVLNDLAVGYLDLGQRDQRLESMLRALDAIELAVERDSTSAPALFNQALILERLYLNASAVRAWSGFLAVEQNAQWRAEANQHLARITAST